MADEILAFAGDSATISLYFDLEQGRKADLETAARTAIAFARMIRQVANHVDFTSELRIELESGTKGSLGLNTIVRVVKGFSGKHPVLTSIIVTTLLQLSGDVRSWTSGQVLEWLTGKDAPVATTTLTDDQLSAIAEDAAKLIAEGIAKKEREQVFKEAMRDPAVKGLGGTGVPGKRPEVIVPRSQFASSAGDMISEYSTAKERTQKTAMLVTLVRPRLKAEVANWRFQHGSLPEFSAEMRDRDFLEAMAQNRVSLPLKVGIEMEIEIETEEIFEGGVWVVKKRSVTRVINPATTPPPSLF